jgi:hypothetical protein
MKPAPSAQLAVGHSENIMADKQTDKSKKVPEPGSPEDLLPETESRRDPDKEIGEKGEPPSGGNFA